MWALRTETTTKSTTQLQQKYLRKQEDKEININFKMLEFNILMQCEEELSQMSDCEK
jgi:hypothetical protein